MPKDVHLLLMVDPDFTDYNLMGRLLKRVIHNYAEARNLHYKNRFIVQINTFDPNSYDLVRCVIQLGMRVHVNIKPHNCDESMEYNIKHGRTQFKMCKNASTYGYKSLTFAISAYRSTNELFFKRADNLFLLSRKSCLPTFVYTYDDPSMSYMMCGENVDNVGKSLLKIPSELESMEFDDDYDNMEDYDEYMFS